MLKAFRENFKHLKWVLWIVIGVFVIFVFVDWGMGSAKGGTEQDIAARVGSFRVTTAEFQREYRDSEDRYKQLYGKNFTPELAKAMRLPEQVITSLIDRHFFQEEAARLGISVTDDEVMTRIFKMKDNQGRPIFVKDGAFVGEATYRRMLAGANLTPAAFEDQARNQALLEKLNRFFTESTFVSDDEVEADFASRTVKAKVSYALLPSSRSTAPAVTDAEAEAHFKANQAAYLQPEKRKAAYLLVDAQKIRSSVNVTDADVAAEYNANLDQFKKKEEVHARHILYKSDGTPAQDAAAKTKADSALKRLRAGAAFEAVARTESDDPGSKASGGDLGSFDRGRMVKEFEDAAFGAEPGALVGPVKTAFGYHIIQVIARTGERTQPIFEVASMIKQRLIDQRTTDEARRVARDLSDRLRKKGDKVSSDDLRKLAGATVSFGETDFLARTDSAPALGPSPAFSQALFSLKADEVSDPVTTARGEAILRVQETKKPGPAQFVEVKARVVADLARKRQDEATLAALGAAAPGGAGPEAAAAKLGLKVETPESFGKSGPIPGVGSGKEILDAVFAAAPGEVKGPFLVAGQGAVLLKVVEKNAFDRQAFDAQKAQIVDQLKNQKSGRILQALLVRKRAESKIDINKDVLARFGGNS
jgi:peptidyl-prolyl cis-trans isomerase D